MLSMHSKICYFISENKMISNLKYENIVLFSLVFLPDTYNIGITKSQKQRNLKVQ